MDQMFPMIRLNGFPESQAGNSGTPSLLTNLPRQPRSKINGFVLPEPLRSERRYHCGLRRIDWALGQKGADLLVIALGGNDGLRGLSPEQTEKNLTGIVAKARAKNPSIKILIAGMQMPDNLGPKYVESFKMTFAKVAEGEKTELLPFLLEGVGGDEKLNQADRIHPNAEGQRKIAELVWAKLKGML